MARRKKILPGDVSREMAEDAFARYADADARQQQLTAKMDVQITKIREKYADDLDSLADVKEKAFDEIHAFAENNRNEFGKKKSIELTHGVIGFRTGMPRLKTLKGYTWASVLNLLKEFLPAYVRKEEKPAKDKLLDDRDIEEINKLFKKCGIYVDQDEYFFVDPKKELA